MATYYVDPAAGGANNGSSWGDAWTSFASAVAAPVAANDIVYCRGTENRTTAITMGISGTATISGAGAIHYIGCNAAGTARAGQFTIQGQAGSVPNNVFLPNGKSYIIMENITFKTANLTVVNNAGSAATYWYFNHCKFSNGGSSGTGAAWAYCMFHNCEFVSNTATGITVDVSCMLLNCYAALNGTYGIVAAGISAVIGCVGANNGDDNIALSGGNGFVVGCTGVSSTAGSGLKFATAANNNFAAWNRFVDNNQYGIEVPAGTSLLKSDLNGYHGNGVGEKTNAPGALDVSLAADGFINQAGSDFGLSDTAEQRRTVVTLDWTNTLSKHYAAMGAIPNEIDVSSQNTDPGVGNVIKDVAYKILNVSKTGTFDEAARNVGTAAGNILTGQSIKILNSTTNGSFDEAARNTDPAEENVKSGVTYKIQNANKTGSYSVPGAKSQSKRQSILGPKRGFL